jgi:hypothetical protein
MDLPTRAILDLLTFLLPGFITAALVYNLTPAPRPVPFERVVQALIFTILIQSLVSSVQGVMLWLGRRLGAAGPWNETVQLGWAIALAAVLGLLLAWSQNSDRLHRILRTLRITHQTSFPSEWFGAMSQNRGYIVLHIKGERRLYGWPVEWPSVPDRGHFVMAEAEWLTNEGSVVLDGVHRMVIRVEDVEMVEVMKIMQPPPKERNDGPA